MQPSYQGMLNFISCSNNHMHKKQPKAHKAKQEGAYLSRKKESLDFIAYLFS